MNTIENREDISLLVNTFYSKIRNDDLLADIFNKHIREEQWPGHLEKLTDFWETNLFGIPKFKGSPSSKHIAVDSGQKHSIDQAHFGRWLLLWFETIDQLFEGKLAIRAKETARKMAFGQFLAMWKNRPQNK